jgi:hypothetical protein
MANCHWNDDGDYHRYHLAACYYGKRFWGLGIPNLRELNLCLLGSWIRIYSLDKDKLWKQIVDYKHETSSPNIFACGNRGVSNFWKWVLWVARAAKFGFRWKLGNGANVRFWEDVWLGNSSLACM